MPRRTAKRHAQDVTVRISGVQSMPAVLESLGADSARILAAEKVDPALFDDTENPISLATVGRLVHRSVEVTGCQHFGLLVGQQGGLSSFGLVGAFARYSPDLQTALGRLGTYQHLYHGGQILSLEASRDVATLSYAIVQPGIKAVDQIEDGALAIFCNVMRGLCGANWLPLEVRFAHRRPATPGRSCNSSRLPCSSMRNRAGWCSRRTGCGVACPNSTPICSACSRGRSSRLRPPKATNSQSRS